MYVNDMGFADTVIYQDKQQKPYSLKMILQKIASEFVRKISKQNKVAVTDDFNWTKKQIEEAYLRAILSYAQRNGQQHVQLMGSCGGGTVSTDEILKKIMGETFADVSGGHLNPANFLSIYSSDFRKLTNTSQDYKNDPNLCHCGAADGPHFHCPGKNKESGKACQHAIIVGEGINKCPDCGLEATCK